MSGTCAAVRWHALALSGLEKPSVLLGFGLALGSTLIYLSLIVLISKTRVILG